MEERLLAILRLAIKYNATDIHFLLKGMSISIEMRINNEMRRLKTKYNDDKLIRYLQYLANLDLGKQLEPQTGHFEMKVDDSNLSMRFAVINGVDYCNAVLRILNHNLPFSPDSLSLIKEQNDYFKNILKRNTGLIIFSGPTGSGKTTTLYTLLKSKRGSKIYTIEDPVEIYCDDFIQLQINETIGFDYEAGIKQLLRHDPDVIMIGEIRDSKAAKMAVVAANTGHLVLTTIHAANASSVISRMVELGVDKTHLYEVLISVSNQRMLFNSKTHKKQVFYEVMVEKEIEYFKNNGKNSDKFISLHNQINKEGNDDYIEVK